MGYKVSQDEENIEKENTERRLQALKDAKKSADKILKKRGPTGPTMLEIVQKATNEMCDVAPAGQRTKRISAVRKALTKRRRRKARKTLSNLRKSMNERHGMLNAPGSLKRYQYQSWVNESNMRANVTLSIPKKVPPPMPPMTVFQG